MVKAEDADAAVFAQSQKRAFIASQLLMLKKYLPFATADL